MRDMHTHILPQIDDGSSSIDETMKMIKEAYRAGFTDIFATSHYIEGRYEFNKTDRKYIINAIQEKLDEEEIDLKLHIGAEAYISSTMVELVKNETIPCLGSSRYVLFELPLRSKIFYTENIIERLIALNYIPIIAHPERYDMVQEEPEVVLDWVRAGALLQANFASIDGVYGSKAKNILLKLLEANAIHFLGTDTHMSNSFYLKISDFKEMYIKEIGKKRFEILTYDNPMSVLEDEEIDVEEPKKIKSNKMW